MALQVYIELNMTGFSVVQSQKAVDATSKHSVTAIWLRSAADKLCL